MPEFADKARFKTISIEKKAWKAYFWLTAFRRSVYNNGVRIHGNTHKNGKQEACGVFHKTGAKRKVAYGQDGDKMNNLDAKAMSEDEFFAAYEAVKAKAVEKGAINTASLTINEQADRFEKAFFCEKDEQALFEDALSV